MKTAAISIWILGSLIFCFQHFASYWLGYSESGVATLADNGLLAFCLDLFIFILLIVLTLSLLFIKRKKGDIVTVIAAVVCFWPTVLLILVLLDGVFGSDGKLVTYGLLDRLENEYTLNGLRDLAQDVKTSGLLDNTTSFAALPNPLTQTEEQKAALDQLNKKYPFLFPTSNDEDYIPMDVFYKKEDANSVRIEWHDGPKIWGFLVSIDGGKLGPFSEYEGSCNYEEDLRPTDYIKIFYYNGSFD